MATQEHVTRLRLAVESLKSCVNNSSLYRVQIGSSSLSQGPLPDLLARLVNQGEFAIINAPAAPDGAVSAAAALYERITQRLTDHARLSQDESISKDSDLVKAIESDMDELNLQWTHFIAAAIESSRLPETDTDPVGLVRENIILRAQRDALSLKLAELQNERRGTVPRVKRRRRIAVMSQHQHWLVFVGIFLFYLALAPLSLSQMGYQRENAETADYIAGRLTGQAVSPVRMPANGILEPVLETPLMLLAQPFNEIWRERISSLEPILLISFAVLIVFIWSQKLDRVWALPLTLIFALATTIWPYAYIGIEPAQLLFLVLSGYLALGSDSPRTWKAALAFALSSGLALNLMPSSAALAPAIGYLLICYFSPAWKQGILSTRSYLLQTAALAIPSFVFYPISAYSRGFSRTWQSNPFRLQNFLVGDPAAIILNAISLFISTNKGLLIYCPVVLLCLLALKPAFRTNRSVVILACLALLGQVAIASVTYFWSDETWGPRYLQCTIAPLFIVIAASKAGRPLILRRELALAAFAIWGLLISVLGNLFPYQTLQRVALVSSPSTIEQLQYDARWNPIRFNLHLIKQRLFPNQDIYWPPIDHPNPPLSGEPTTEVHPVSLTPYAAFQPYLLASWRHWHGTLDFLLWLLCSAALIVGPALVVLSQSAVAVDSQVPAEPVAASVT
jgi:hypothetical protein